MSASNESPISAIDLLQLGRPYWLPPYGHGNGLDALFWGCIAELPRSVIPVALEALRAQDIPGWAAPIAAPYKTHGMEGDEAPYRLWVATIQYDSAEDVLMRVLNDSAARVFTGVASDRS